MNSPKSLFWPPTPPSLCRGIWVGTMIGPLKKPWLNFLSGWREIRNAFLVIRWVRYVGVQNKEIGAASRKLLTAVWLCLDTCYFGRTKTVAETGQGPVPPPLIFGPNWGPEGRKIFFFKTRAPLPPYLNVCICHRMTAVHEWRRGVCPQHLIHFNLFSCLEENLMNVNIQCCKAHDWRRLKNFFLTLYLPVIFVAVLCTR